MELGDGPLSNVNLKEIPGGTLLHLRVKPGARKNEILGVHGGALKLGVVARPEKRKANRSVLKLLARILDLRPASQSAPMAWAASSMIGRPRSSANPRIAAMSAH